MSALAAEPVNTPTNAPATVDLRPKFDQWGLERRVQGKRPTCSAFTVAGALEFAVATSRQKGQRLSVEFLNWAANQHTDHAQDGGFFSDLWKGYAAYGICVENDMPYQAEFDSKRAPTPEAREQAKAKLGECGLRLHWIKEWNVHTGLTDQEFQGVKSTLRAGWPVCGGFRWPKAEKWEDEVLQMCGPEAVRDGHSVLLVGFRDDSAQPGGGVFIFRNTSNHGRDGFMPYGYAREYMNDAVWIDFAARQSAASVPPGTTATQAGPGVWKGESTPPNPASTRDNPASPEARR